MLKPLSFGAKFVGTLVGSIFLIFLVWLMIGYIKYGDNIIYYHLDLERTFKSFKVDFNIQSFTTTFNSFVNSIKRVNNSNPIFKQLRSWFESQGYGTNGDWWEVALNGLFATLDPVQLLYNMFIIPIYLLIMVIALVGNIVSVIGAIFSWLFNPVFITTFGTLP